MIEAVLIGAGARGIGVYGAYALIHPNDIKFVAVAEPDPMRRAYFSMQHDILPNRQFSDYDELLDLGRIADCCFICTQDHMHVEPAMMAMAVGYHIFLEKPMAVSVEDCVLLVKEAETRNLKLMIAHVLRYTPFFSQIKDWLDAGKIGRLMSIQHNENVSFWHQAHSYVRGNWRNDATSSPMILAKSCHDLDLMVYFAQSEVSEVASFGDLSYFTRANCPDHAPDFCMDGCPHQDSCVYYAPKVYTNGPIWMKLAVSNDMSESGLLAALRHGPYGRCVYQTDNNVVDHQVVIIRFQNEVTVSFTMTGFTTENTRTIKLMGTEGQIRGHLDKNELELWRFDTPEPEVIQLGNADLMHGGGDIGIMDDFVQYMISDDPGKRTNLQEALKSHVLAFMAEESRRTKSVVSYETFMSRYQVATSGVVHEHQYYQAIELASKTFQEDMRHRFLLLLGQANMKRMHQMTVHGKIRALVNYYPSTLLVDRHPVKVASIGAVCTEEAYRKRNFASKLLVEAEDHARSEGISLLIISGYGGIYERFGATRVGDLIGYQIHTQPWTDHSYYLREYRPSDFDKVYRLFLDESLRFERSEEEFQSLLKGQMHPLSLVEFAMDVIVEGEEVIAYAFLRIDLIKHEILVREYGGQRKAISEILPTILLHHDQEVLLFPAPRTDEIHTYLKAYPSEPTDQHASFKVIDWGRFIQELSPYIRNTQGSDMKMTFAKDHGFTLSIGSSCVHFSNQHALHRFVFGPWDDLDIPETSPFRSVFPLPIVWTHNLNYQ
ncbi:MAG: GNAT family N-acetyltransferase [Candidatus Izemoplasmatales bacterium]